MTDAYATPVGELYVLRLLQSSSCFAVNRDGNKRLVCGSIPCACAQSLLDEIGNPLHAEIERLRAALQYYADSKGDADNGTVARRALEDKP